MNIIANGNLLSLSRKGKTGANSWGDIDQLSYIYQANSNKIQAVNDAILLSNPNVGDFRDSSNIATQYTYNQDGSLNYDDNKKISFEWNYLKKPKKITKANGQWQKFMYDASGVLLQTLTSTGKKIDHFGNLTFENDVLYQISHDEGRINASGQYEYDINDHAGNLRVTFRDSSGIAKIVTKLDYDVWGFRLKGLDYYANYASYNKFKTFSGKELHEDFGFNLLSYKFRFHDPALGRFISIDPLAEEYSYNSTFAFAENKLGLGVEYEGLEMMPFPIFGEVPPVMIEPTITRPMIEPTFVRPMSPISRLVPEAVGRTIETFSRTSRFTPEQKANFARGNKVEAEQLEKLGLEKNTKPYEAIDPKTGQKGKTIPEAMEDGKTFEIKNVSKQSLTRQLRLQKEVSNSNGKDPGLIINKDAKITEPLRNGGFDIRYYTPAPAKIDNTSVKPSIKNTTASNNPCNGDPNCL